jgi:small-conductance mechanosensitive channel
MQDTTDIGIPVVSNYPTILKIIVIIVSAFVVNKVVRALIGGYFKRESARINVDPTTYNFLKNALTFVIITIAILNIVYVIPAFKEVAVTLFAGAGILAAIIGFASQAAFSNIINGVMIVMFKPFRIGDVVEVGTRTDTAGMVEDITLRHTVIRNFENKRVVIPNSVISSEVIVNRSIVDERMIRFLEIGVSFDTDLDKAMAIIQEEAMKHPAFIDGREEEEKERNEPAVRVMVRYISTYSVVIRAYLWAKDSPESFVYLTDMYKIIFERFRQEGIEVPLPYTHVLMHPSAENETSPPKPE